MHRFLVFDTNFPPLPLNLFILFLFYFFLLFALFLFHISASESPAARVTVCSPRRGDNEDEGRGDPSPFIRSVLQRVLWSHRFHPQAESVTPKRDLRGDV